MSEYVYAMQTAIREIDGRRIGVAEFRYKTFLRDEMNERMYKQSCARRDEHFKTNALPEFHVIGRIKPDAEVYKTETAIFGNGDQCQKKVVGRIIREGHKYALKLVE